MFGKYQVQFICVKTCYGQLKMSYQDKSIPRQYWDVFQISFVNDLMLLRITKM